MASNTGNNRIAVKWVRDKAKAAYQKTDHCAICNTNQDLELHHTHSITKLLFGWAAARGYDISTDEGILAHRDEFIEEHYKELYDDVFTLCNKHHVKLHALFGKTPNQGSEARQKLWIENQKAKLAGGATSDLSAVATKGTFAEFY